MKTFLVAVSSPIMSSVWLNAQVADKITVIEDPTTDPAPSSFKSRSAFPFQMELIYRSAAHGDPGLGTYSGFNAIADEPLYAIGGMFGLSSRHANV